MCLPGPGTSTRTLTIFWRSWTWIAVRQPTGRSSARCRRRAGAARTTSNTRCPRASFSPTRSKRGTRSSSTSATQCTRVCSVTSAMRDHIPIHTVSPARRAVLCSPPIKVSPPITAQLAGWLNWTSAANPLDRDLRPYSLTVVPQLDRVVTTSADMHGVTVGRSVQVWRLSDLTLLHTVLLPPGPRGNEHLHPAEVRAIGDGTSVMVATFRCGLYVLSELDGIPVAKLARSFPWSAVEGEDTDCNVPVRSGRFWLQPVGTTGSLVVLDVSTPEKPVIADELAFGVDARPHWLALEPGGKRIVMTGGGTLAGGVYLIDMDPETGKLRLAGDLPAAGSGIPGIRYDRYEWPHGKTGPAFAHGAVFGSVK